MYGKVIASMYEGTLYGHWQAIVAFQQMIVLCDIDGVVDMTPQAIAARTSIPLEIIQEGIKILEQPDEYSRTPGEDGKRIVRLDMHRPWGWQIVNYAKYRHLQDQDTVREQNRERQRRHREKDAVITEGNAPSRSVTEGNAPSRSVTEGNAPSRHVEVDAEVDSEKNPPTPQGGLAIGLDAEAWSRWETYRREIRKPIKPASMLAAQRKLAGFGTSQAAVVEHCIANGWQGLFPLDRRKAGLPKERGLVV